MSSHSEHEAVANLIRTFLSGSPLQKGDTEADDEEGELSTSEDDFEQISQSDLEGLQEADEVKAVMDSLVANGEQAAGDSDDVPQQEVSKELDCGESPS